MPEKKFDSSLKDSQATAVHPVAPENFDAEKYAKYEQKLLEGNRKFWSAKQGVAVYRRFRVGEIFADGCRDMKRSLALQLGALTESMKYPADIANFLEPWYGIGVTASTFGGQYLWKEGLAPALDTHFHSVEDLLKIDPVPIEQTEIGKNILRMIDYFLEQTGGQIPISPTDTQSALNACTFFIDNSSLFMDFFENPETVTTLMRRMTDLTIEFTRRQVERIGEALALPGHGFASSRNFSGLGMSNDVITMISGEHYRQFDVPFIQRAGEAFGGAVFHSCGNWSNKIEAVKAIPNLRMVDAAFSRETDPDPNPTETFAKAFAGSGIAVNARIVGDAETVIQKFQQLWRPEMKVVVVSYCPTPEEQQRVFEEIHDIAGM